MTFIRYTSKVVEAGKKVMGGQLNLTSLAGYLATSLEKDWEGKDEEHWEKKVGRKLDTSSGLRNVVFCIVFM